jgi:predicted glycoside hydrolase/deacetylase ChbG (UPF0249 family)
VQGKRYLIVTADDFGIGPATSQGILDLAIRGSVKASVLLVNSPHAEKAVRLWRQASCPFELGWHPCLTLDCPVLPPAQVPSLVGPDGRFLKLSGFVQRLLVSRVRAAELRAELQAQHDRFKQLVGHAPTLVNSHHHVQVFSLVGKTLLHVLNQHWPIPYVRRIREPGAMLARVPGARVKRSFLTLLGRADARRQEAMGFPGNEWLAGITDPPWVANPKFLSRWLARIPGEVVELTCHPGYLDRTLVGRDCALGDGQLLRRVHEFSLLQQENFHAACRRAGFTLVSPRELLEQRVFGDAHAA